MARTGQSAPIDSAIGGRPAKCIWIGSEFTHYDPRTLQLLKRALEEAWVASKGGPLRDIDEQVARQLLAKSILAVAATGERDLDELKRHALHDLGVQVWRQSITGAEAA